MMLRPAHRAAATLALFTAIGVGVVAGVHHFAHPRAIANRQHALEAQISAVLPDHDYDHPPLTDTVIIQDSARRGAAALSPVYRARVAGQPAAAAFELLAPNGYNGPIRLLLGVRADGRISGIHVLSHRETPGLGDAIALHRSDWMTQFNGHGLTAPAASDWRTRKDGGAFDQLTGATITSRAVINALANGLHFVQQHQHELFPTTPHAPKQSTTAH